MHLQHAAQIATDGVAQGCAGKPPVDGGSGLRMALQPVGIALRHLAEHAAHGGTDFVHAFRDDAHAAQFGFMNDEGRDDFQDGLFAGQSQTGLLNRAAVSGKKDMARRGFRAGIPQKGIDLVFQKTVAAFGMGLPEKLRNGGILDGELHECVRLPAFGRRRREWLRCGGFPG